MKILVADDNAVARSVLRAFLDQAGFKPVVVENGEEALKVMLGEHPPAVAILDWMMPGLSGLDVCMKIRAASLPIRPYIIMLTARSTKADVALGLDAGADEFITKPFNQVEMMARLRVARRMVEYERELKGRLDEMVAMVERYKLLGAMVAQHAAPPTPVESPIRETQPPAPSEAEAQANLVPEEEPQEAPPPTPPAPQPAPAPTPEPAATTAPATEAAQAPQPPPAAEPTPPEPAAPQAVSTPSAPPFALPTPPTTEQLPEGPQISLETWAATLRQTFSSLSWPDPKVDSTIVETPYVRPPILGWTGFFVEPGQEWFDLLLGVDQPTLETLFVNAMRRQPGSDRVIIDYLAETVNLIANDIKFTLENRSFTVTSPFLSRGSRATSLGRGLPVPQGMRERLDITMGDKRAELTIVRRPCPVKKKSAGQLNIGDILAEAFQPSDDYHIPLLNKGTVLSERFIERLVALTRDDRKTLHLPVFERAPLAAHFAPSRSGRMIEVDGA